MKTSKNCRRVVILLFALLTLAFAGCQRSVYDMKISAKTPEDLNQWISINTHRLNMEDIEEVRACLNEIRISFMMSKSVSGAENLSIKLSQKVDGMLLRDMIVAGYALQLERLETEKARLVGDLDYKKGLRTKPGDTASERFLADQMEMVRIEISKFDEKINQCTERLKKFRARLNIPETSADDALPQRMA